MASDAPKPADDAADPVSLDADWQRLWFATMSSNWTSLAIVPSDIGIDAEQTAEALVSVGSGEGSVQVAFLDARGTTLTQVQQLLEQMKEMTRRGERVVVAVDPLKKNPAAIPVVRATSHALLLVRTGESRLASARTTVEIIGTDRLIGSVVVT